ncbi:MAG: cytochrome C assembly protein [Planctomycetaceae bacterium]|nr:MAG: cytochrome C assembly protein [Planctomycetaceae bacterium]
MQTFLGGISITCFVGSYVVAMLLDISRSVGKLPGRGVLTIGFTLAGLFTQAVYLIVRAVGENESGDRGLLAGWHDWSLLVAWGLAACFLTLYLRRPDTSVGLFLLPPVLVLVALAWPMRSWEPFSRDQAVGLWRTAHGLSMMVGTAAVLMGFIAGLMYLTQARRLRSKQVGGRGLRLPTLERLQAMNRHCLVVSTIAVGIGLVAGVVMNLNRWGNVSWNEGGVILSLILLVWLLAATAAEFFYRPARQGRKIVYLTLASFGFLVLAIYGTLSSEHARGSADSATTTSLPVEGDLS